MNSYRSVYLKKGRSASLQRKHPWIFSGAISKRDKGIKDGDVINVKSDNNEILATAHFQNGSIMCRILSFNSDVIDQAFFETYFKSALDFRKNHLNLPNNKTNCYRLIHGEGDHLPGLIIDIYGKTAVIQAHSVGMAKSIMLITEAIKAVFQEKITTVYNRSKESIDIPKEGLLWGKDLEEDIVIENGNEFVINWARGQKTGFFLDQRNNRDLVGHLAKNKKVLNLFSYTGGFSIYALNNKAEFVTSIDISQNATTLVDRNVELISNQVQHESLTQNVLDYVKSSESQLDYDIVIVDPPAFAKSRHKRHNAIQAYRRLNAAVFKRAKTNSLILTFSCSQVVDVELFKGAIVSAGIDARRDIRIIKQLSQGGDHPINLFHPEGHYLKGYLLQIH